MYGRRIPSPPCYRPEPVRQRCIESLATRAVGKARGGCPKRSPEFLSPRVACLWPCIVGGAARPARYKADFSDHYPVARCCVAAIAVTQQRTGLHPPAAGALVFVCCGYFAPFAAGWGEEIGTWSRGPVAFAAICLACYSPGGTVDRAYTPGGNPGRIYRLITKSVIVAVATYGPVPMNAVWQIHLLLMICS